MATPNRSLLSGGVSTGGPTRESEYDNLRTDVQTALTEVDYGTTAQKTALGTPVISQRFMDSTLDVMYISFDGVSWYAIASDIVTIDDSGIEVTGTGVSKLGAGAVAPVGTDKWVT
jgi:hypothetical protein